MAIPEGLMPTPFHKYTPEHIEDFIDVYGYAVPLWISDPEREYDAIRNRVGILEFSMLYKWDVRGPEAVAVVDAVFSRNVRDLSIGRVAYGVVTDEAGFMVDDCTVMVYSPDYVRVFGGNPRTMELLEDACGDLETVTEHRKELAVLSVQGPKSRELLQRLTSADLSNQAFPYYTFKTGIEIAGVTAQINRLGFTAELGYEVMVALGDADTLFTALMEAGADLGVEACSAAALMMCRVEAGMIMGELEYDSTVSPYECRMGWAVDLDKGPWLGRDALLARRDSDSGRVVSVVIAGDPEAAEGAALHCGGQIVGAVTMAVPSPQLDGATLALARINRSAASVGTELEVIMGDSVVKGQVVSTPVFDPERVRVRS